MIKDYIYDMGYVNLEMIVHMIAFQLLLSFDTLSFWF